MDFSAQYQQIQGSVIRVLGVSGQGVNQQILSSGTGVLIKDGTKAITCSHCIKQQASTVGVISGQNHGQVANIIFNDTTLDIAIIEFQQSLGSGITLGNSDDVKIGQEAFVVGFPSHSINETALGANIAGFENNNGIQLIKIDASVNHGNSGGPLFNSNGELIGIVNSKFGNLSRFLNQIQQARPQSAIVLSGINPVQVIQQLISEMKRNLNLGVGSAIPVKAISDATDLIV